jgi:hypothetical protein
MNEETFQRKLGELIAEIGTLPEGERGKLEVLAAETRERHRQLKETVSSLQESIDFVRLSIKYMLFDLEATRRENAQLRKMLEEGQGQ